MYTKDNERELIYRASGVREITQTTTEYEFTPDLSKAVDVIDLIKSMDDQQEQVSELDKEKALAVKDFLATMNEGHENKIIGMSKHLVWGYRKGCFTISPIPEKATIKTTSK